MSVRKNTFSPRTSSQMIYEGQKVFFERGKIDVIEIDSLYAVRRPRILPKSLLCSPQDQPGSKHGSMMEKKSSYRGRPIFHAELNGKPVLVKFRERYNERAHRHLANIKLAPEIHTCSKQPPPKINIMIAEKVGCTVKTKSGEEEVAGISIDAMFDLAGNDGQARYSALLNENIDGVDDVAPAAVMRKEHDLGMMRKLG
ncbi:uncharacterized protein LAESUDRAFT_750566 [Laetiporus sulphureus 93-53]|uniref:Uncharacterized protein n=1 Tax=Laetiporus sulphureus 93-53 TaxID=1314785 RepID=A0A165DUN8_9APHY|nr:uncharacterized protein LAESUDRAFT_750566 [Laetiporus sulphureus 93-53]KZT05663.1 hypothetical protein LAESUDRAFT_750566 [Laetiporus sulphureus 93-53]